MRRSLVHCAFGLILFACSASDNKADGAGKGTGTKEDEPEQNSAGEKKGDDATSSGGPKAAACGDGKCDPGETCKSCAGDCGACPVCTLANACSTIPTTPAKLSPSAKFDVRMEAMPKDQILARLVADAEQGSPGLTLIASALNEPQAGEIGSITVLRKYFATRPVTSEVLRRELKRPELANALLRMPVVLKTPPKDMRIMDGNTSGGGTADAGAADPKAVCEPPKLRMRISRITVNEEDDDIANDVVYCNVASEAPGGSELRITPKTRNLDEGQSQDFSGADGIFWGVEAPRDAAGDITVRYDCYEEDADNGYAQFVQRAVELIKQNNVNENGDQYLRWKDGYGWIGTATDLLVKYLPSILALDSDDHLFVATQTIPRADQLALTSGATWTVRKKGTHLWSDWDWSVKVDAWGCVENGVVTP